MISNASLKPSIQENLLNAPSRIIKGSPRLLVLKKNGTMSVDSQIVSLILKR